MVTSRISYSTMHYELSHPQDRVLAPLQELSRLRIDTREPNMPVLYVAMATWIPKCNMYHHNNNNSKPEAEDCENQRPDDKSEITEVIDVKNVSDVEVTESTNEEDEKNAIVRDDDEVNPKQEQEDVKLKYDCRVILTDVGSDPTKPDRKFADLEAVTPKKTNSPGRLLKKLESEKKRLERQKEKEERETKRLKEKEERDMKKLKEKEERDRLKEEKLKQKQEKDEVKLKEKMERQEARLKEKEVKEQKRREKEEKDELKRKEMDEKNREKQKLEEQKQKAAAVFVNFFVTKKPDAAEDKKEVDRSKFMPFEIKSDMRLASITRRTLNPNDKTYLDGALELQDETSSYLVDLQKGKLVRESGKTWIPDEATDDDVVVVEDNALGETIVEQKPKVEKMRAKFFKFHENQRPPYFGTWRKRSKLVSARNPLRLDKNLVNYEVDSDDEWEEEGEGESLRGSDEDEKENDSDNEYEVDNEFFVPHGHLSDDEVDDERNAKMSPESHKAKLKLLKNEFDEEMKSKTQKIKPRVIGCIWYDKNRDNVEEAIDRYLQPLSLISNGQIVIQKRSSIIASSALKKPSKRLETEHVPLLLKLIHGNVKKRKILVNEFLEYLSHNGFQVEVSKLALGKQFKEFARWMKCPDQGVMHNKLCWYVAEDVRKEYNVDAPLPNKWDAINKKDVVLE